MSAKKQHIHRGHCQLCSGIQAIDPITGLIAKHGYTVEWGYFDGTCPGSDNWSLHTERGLNDTTVINVRMRGHAMESQATMIELFKADPEEAWDGTYKLVEVTPRRGLSKRKEKVRNIVPYKACTREFQMKARKEKTDELRASAKRCFHYASFLEREANRIYKKIDPYPVEDLRRRGLKVGDVVRIGGKSGWNATIEAIEDREYKPMGFYRNDSQMIPHARITRPAIAQKTYKDGTVSVAARTKRTWWEPLRFLKKPKETNE